MNGKHHIDLIPSLNGVQSYDGSLELLQEDFTLFLLIRVILHLILSMMMIASLVSLFGHKEV